MIDTEIDFVAAVIESIYSGDCDEGLDRIKAEVNNRLWKIEQEERLGMGDDKPFVVGGTVQVVGRLKPNYLLNGFFIVKQVNRTTVDIFVPNIPRFRRYAGGTARIPMSALKVIHKDDD